MHALPTFGVDAFADLLVALRDSGADLKPVSAMPDPVSRRVAYVRHDIDLHLTGVERMAQVEADLGVSATYFILVTQHYNPLYPPNRAVLHRLVELGHEIGLHYDLTTYPEDAAAALAHLDWEVGVLAGAAGAPVRCISMHQPYRGRPDIFRELSTFIHPHNPAFGANLTYVSDSCRAWRDESLLEFVNGGDLDGRLLLLAHPEAWLAPDIADRMSYLERVLLPNVTGPARQFVEETVRSVWLAHPGAAMHDAREARRSAAPAGSFAD